jgi:integrase
MICAIRSRLSTFKTHILAYIRDQLGHSSIKVTVDYYGHLVAGGQRYNADLPDDGT